MVHTKCQLAKLCTMVCALGFLFSAHLAAGQIELPPREEPQGEEEYTPPATKQAKKQPAASHGSAATSSHEIKTAEKSTSTKTDSHAATKEPAHSTSKEPAHSTEKSGDHAAPKDNGHEAAKEDGHEATQSTSQSEEHVPAPSTHETEKNDPHSTKLIESDGAPVAGKQGSGLLWFAAVFIALIISIFVFT